MHRHTTSTRSTGARGVSLSLPCAGNWRARELANKPRGVHGANTTKRASAPSSSFTRVPSDPGRLLLSPSVNCRWDQSLSSPPLDNLASPSRHSPRTTQARLSSQQPRAGPSSKEGAFRERERMARGSSWRLTVAGVVLVVVCAAAVLAPPAAALDIGIQSAGDGVSKQQACSRTCESDHCTTAPFLRYGKYCGILYSGCPGEAPCDALDACCMHHDNCVQAKKDYLSTGCNEALLDCLAKLREGTDTFEGNKCMIDEVIDVITVVIEAAVVAGKVLHKP